MLIVQVGINLPQGKFTADFVPMTSRKMENYSPDQAKRFENLKQVTYESSVVSMDLHQDGRSWHLRLLDTPHIELTDCLVLTIGGSSFHRNPGNVAIHYKNNVSLADSVMGFDSNAKIRLVVAANAEIGSNRLKNIDR